MWAVVDCFVPVYVSAGNFHKPPLTLEFCLDSLEIAPYPTCAKATDLPLDHVVVSVRPPGDFVARAQDQEEIKISCPSGEGAATTTSW